MQSSIVKVLTVEFVGILGNDLQGMELIFAAHGLIAAKTN
jgi:hypothetical protein